MNEYKSRRLGQLLKEARLARGWSIRQVADAAGIAVGQVHKLENDRVAKVAPAHLVALAGPLQQPVHRLLRAAGYPTHELSLLEPELAEQLADLPPQALEQISQRVREWLHEQSAAWPVAPATVDIEPSTDDNT